MIMPAICDYITPFQRCVLKIHGEMRNAVFQECHMFSFGGIKDNRQTKYETIKRRFRSEKPIAFRERFVSVVFNGEELSCYLGDDGNVLIEV